MKIKNKLKNYLCKNIRIPSTAVVIPTMKVEAFKSNPVIKGTMNITIPNIKIIVQTNFDKWIYFFNPSDPRIIKIIPININCTPANKDVCLNPK